MIISRISWVLTAMLHALTALYSVHFSTHYSACQIYHVQGLVVSCSTMFSSQHLMASDYKHSGNDFGHEAVILGSSARDQDHLMTSNTNHTENGNKLEDQEQKLKRRIANRESARRSRLKKQQHLDQLQMLVHKLTNHNQDMRQKVAQLAEYHQQSMMEILHLREELFLLQNAVSNNKLVPVSTNGNNDFTAASNGFGHPHEMFKADAADHVGI